MVGRVIRRMVVAALVLPRVAFAAELLVAALEEVAVAPDDLRKVAQVDADRGPRQ